MIFCVAFTCLDARYDTSLLAVQTPIQGIPPGVKSFNTSTVNTQ
jgi:hypothetical protein